MTTSTSLPCIASRDTHIAPATALIQNYSIRSNWAICREIAEEAYWWWCDWFLNEVPIPIGTRWKPTVENGTLKTDQVDGEVFQPMHKLKKMHTFPPHQLFFWSKSKSKSKVMRKWNFDHIVINDTLFWPILVKRMPVGRCQDDFDNEQWTHIEHWVDLLVPGTLQTKYWQLKQTIWTLSTFLITFFSVCNKISLRKQRSESCQALMRNYFSCWWILQRKVIFAGVFYNKDTKKKTLFFPGEFYKVFFLANLWRCCWPQGESQTSANTAIWFLIDCDVTFTFSLFL